MEKLNYQVNTANNLGVVCGSGKFLRTKTTIVQRNLCRNNSEENKITKKLKDFEVFSLKAKIQEGGVLFLLQKVFSTA